MSTPARARISIPGQRYSSFKKNTHAGAGISISMWGKDINIHAGAGISISMPGQGYPPGGRVYPCPGVDIDIPAPAWVFFSREEYLCLGMDILARAGVFIFFSCIKY